MSKLARQLRADRAAGPGDHHHLAAHIGGQQLEIGRDRIAPEQILDVDRPQVAHLDAARGDLLERRECLHHHRKRLQHLEREPALAAQRRRRGQQHLGHVLVGDHLADLLRPQHLDAMHQLAGERRIGVDEGDGLVAAGLVERAQELDADGPGAVDDDRFPLVEAHRPVFGRGLKQHGAGPLPAEADEQRGDQGIDHDHRPRMVLDGHHQHHHRPQQRPDDHRDIDAGRALRADEAGDELVQPAHIEDGDADERRRDQQHPFVQARRDIEMAQSAGCRRPKSPGSTAQGR